MNNDTKQLLQTLIPQMETRQAIEDLLNMDDIKFNAIEPEMTKTLKEALTDDNIDRSEINREMMGNSTTADDTQEALNQSVNVIKSDNTLSDKKQTFLINLLEMSLNFIQAAIKNPRKIVKVKVIRTSSDAVLPTYAHDSDAGADIYTIKDEHIPAHKTVLIDTGLQVDIPKGYEIQIRPRSGLSLKTKLRIPNAPATIDVGYHQNIGIIIDNISSKPIDISKGTKIAQMLIKEIPMIQWEEVTEFDSEDRGGGFGSTDKNNEET